MKEWLVRTARTTPVLGRLLRAPGPYHLLAASLQRRSFEGLRLQKRSIRAPAPERVAYVLWRYPMLSETFIRREVLALRQAAVSLQVFALEPDDPPAPIDESSPAGSVTYFGPANTAVGRQFILHALRRRPWTVVRLWLFIVRHGYRANTAWWQDRDVLYLAGQLASVLTEHRVTHVHAPWANQFALVCFSAARLLGATYSVQARASEIHRAARAPEVADALRFAEFVITNSRYNETYLQTRLGQGRVPPIHVIYNGIDLRRFNPGRRVEREAGPWRVLSVGRLVEPKGFEVLLRACRVLLDRGHDLSCEIIGGPSDPADTVTWLRLRMLLAELSLEPFVHFRGAQPFSVVLTAYARAEVFALPCVRARDGSHDITPNALIEAMAMAVPVVSTTSGAIPEIVDDGREGLLVPPNDEDALADAITRLATDAALGRTLGLAARRKVEHMFDVDRNVVPRVRLFRALGASPASRD